MKTLISYIKLKSLTWWASFAPLVLGLFLAFEPVHGLVDQVQIINAITGDLSPAVLINVGLAGIGIRRAVG